MASVDFEFVIILIVHLILLMSINYNIEIGQMKLCEFPNFCLCVFYYLKRHIFKNPLQSIVFFNELDWF